MENPKHRAGGKAKEKEERGVEVEQRRGSCLLFVRKFGLLAPSVCRLIQQAHRNELSPEEMAAEVSCHDFFWCELPIKWEIGEMKTSNLTDVLSSQYMT